MPIISFQEIVHLVIMTLALGYIFSGMVPRVRRSSLYDLYNPNRFDSERLKTAMLMVGPAVILHELSHKLVAMAFGLDAVFRASIGGLGLGVVLKLIGSPIIFFIPGFVQIYGQSSNLHVGLIAFAGPFANLVLWAGSAFILKTKKRIRRKEMIILAGTKKINLFLFIFNMIPIGFFDGAKVFSALFSSLF